MPTIIKTKNSVTATNVPSSLQQGEVAINITDKKVWVGNAATTPILLLGSGADGTFTNLSVTGVATFGAGTVSLPSITTTGDTNTGIFFPAADTIAFTEGGTEAMRIDSTGNIGVGVTPSAWESSTYRALQISTGVGSSSLVSRADSTNGGGLVLNGFYSATGWKYVGSSYSTLYLQNTGTHQWYTSAAGTAGNAITFSEVMRISDTGNVGIGTSTTTDAGLTITTSVSRDGGWNAKLGLQSTGTNNYPTLLFSGCSSASRYGAIVQTASTSGATANQITSSILFVNTSSTAGNITFTTNGNVGTTGDTERMRIDSSGSLRVGTTTSIVTSSEKLTVAVSGPTNAGVFANVGGATDSTVYIVNQSTSGNNLFTQFATEAGAGTVRGSITYNRGAGLVAYNVTSDYRAKDIISPVLDSGKVIDSVPVYMGKMKDATQARPMFIAHETPDYAHTGKKDAVDKDGKPVYQQMDASSLVPVLWAEIQSLRKRVAQLESK